MCQVEEEPAFCRWVRAERSEWNENPAERWQEWLVERVVVVAAAAVVVVVVVVVVAAVTVIVEIVVVRIYLRRR
jgi:hypothetical protein